MSGVGGIAPFFTGTVEPEGQTFDAWPDAALLMSIEQGGIEWSSSYRNGTCRTCIARLHAGAVRYTVEWPGLSEDERAAGCVLPCVALPLGDIRLSRGEG